MNDFLNKIIGNKKAWNMLEARVKTLPRDYQIVYREIQNYMWNLWRFSTSTGDEANSLAILDDLLKLFEGGVANNKSVLEVTGKDIAAFCDELFNATESWRDKFNHDIMKKLGNEKK